jgi:hypothetical protein
MLVSTFLVHTTTKRPKSQGYVKSNGGGETKKNKAFKALFFVSVPRRGLEPPHLAILVPKTSASTNSATWAYI